MKYEELDESAKERARDWWREVDIDWWEPDYDYFAEVLESIGFAVFEVSAFNVDRGEFVQWRGEYSSKYRESTFNIDDVPCPLHCVVKALDSYDTLLKLVNPKDYLAFKVEPFGKMSTSVEVLDYYFPDNIDALVVDQEAIEHTVGLISDWMLSVLREDYDHIMSDEYAEECLVANDYDFDENGKVA